MSETATNPPEFINDQQLSRLIGVATSTLRKWRTRGGGPPFKRFGSCVRYHVADVEKWGGITIDRATLATATTTSTTTGGAGK